MRSLVTLLCIVLTVLVTSFSCVNADIYDLAACSPSYESRSSIAFSWFIERYDFDRIEEYVDEYYIARYKFWEKYLIGKQREFAGRFGLSDIFLRPDFSNYENTKIALSKRIWGNRLLFRYLAPVNNIRNFELFMALKPHRFVTFVARGQMNGEQRIALVINCPLGRDKHNEHMIRQLRRFLGQMEKYTH